MPYVSGGQVLDDRPTSSWRLSVIPEFFWGILNFFVLFFRTLVSPGTNKKGNAYSTDYRVGPGNDPFGPGGGPQRRMGGYRGGRGGPAPPPMAGGG